MENQEKKYKGRGGYHGGGRKSLGDQAKRFTVSISGTKAELEALKEIAKKNGKTVSRYVFDSLL